MLESPDNLYSLIASSLAEIAFCGHLEMPAVEGVVACLGVFGCCLVLCMAYSALRHFCGQHFYLLRMLRLCTHLCVSVVHYLAAPVRR